MIYAYRCTTCGAMREEVNRVEERHSNAPICHGRMVIEIQPAMVSPDIQPYVAVAGDMAGKQIGSRKEHREFLKRNRFVEVGNEPIRPIKNDFRSTKKERHQDISDAIDQVMPKYRG